MKIFLLLFTSILFSFSIKATHISGGEINYKYIGNNQYELNIKIYRDCYNGIPPFDDPLILGIFDSGTNLINNLHIPLDSLEGRIDTGCYWAPSYSICNEMANYTAIVNLPPRPGGYKMAYQRCCRPSYVINVSNVLQTGTTFYATIPDSVFAFDSNPVFISPPTTFVCMDIPFSINSSAIDLDGDSISYSFITPFHGASSNFPLPDTPSSPPYQTISFLPPYSVSNILAGTFNIDNATGIITGTATGFGVYTYAIEVSEFRYGTLIGSTIRDFQIAVLNYVGIEELENNFTFIQTENSINFTNKENYFSPIELSIYDVVGNKINTQKEKSSSEINFDTSSLQSGIYFYELRMSDKIKTGKFFVN